MSDLSTSFGKYGTSLHLGRVDGYNTEVSDDADQTFIPTGTLDITLVTKEGTLTGVPFVMPAVGSSTFMGSLPEIGSSCIVGFFGQQQPVILGFLPKGLSNLIGSRGVIPNLQPGEVLLQASSSDADVDGNDQQFVGAAIKLDSYGRVIITVPDYKITIGYLLSNENTPDVTSENDPITGEAIFIHEVGPGGTQRRVGASGSTVWQYGKDKVERVGGDVDTRVEGQMVVVARAGQTYQDRRGNSFGIDTDGGVFVEAPTGGWSVDVQADASHEIGGQDSYNVLKSYRRTVGGDHSTTVGGNRKTIVGSAVGPPTGDTTVVLGLAGSTELVVVGAKQIMATLGFNLIAGAAPPTPVPFPAIPAAGGFILTAAGPIAITGAVAAAITAGAALTLTAGAATTIFSPTVLIGPAGGDPVVTVSGLLTFMSILVGILTSSPTSAPGTPLCPAAAGALASVPLAGSKTVFGSP